VSMCFIYVFLVVVLLWLVGLLLLCFVGGLFDVFVVFGLC